MKKRILVVSQYFFPEQFRINDICAEWVKRGYDVTVLTGIPNYPQGRFYEGYGWLKRRTEDYNGIRIVRLPIWPRGGNQVMLSLNYISFVISGFFWQLLTDLKAQYVFIFEVSPMTQALPGIWYAKKRDIPCYIYVQDLWPDNVETLAGIANQRIINAIGRMVDYIYARCERIFVPSIAFVEAIVCRGVDETKIEYWPQYAEDFYRPIERKKIKEIPQDDALNIIFTGNVGSAQGLEILPITASRLTEMGLQKKVRFNIVGDGRYKESLIRETVALGVQCMFNFVPRQPAVRIPTLLAASDVAFLSLSDNPIFRKTVPAKLQSYLACGIPIIAATDGETSKIVLEAGAGITSPAGDSGKLSANIVKILNSSEKDLMQMGENGLNYYRKHFDKIRLLDIMDTYFNMGA